MPQISSISKQHSLHACSDTLLGIYTSFCQLTTFIISPTGRIRRAHFLFKMHKMASLLFRNKYMLKKIYETVRKKITSA